MRRSTSSERLVCGGQRTLLASFTILALASANSTVDANEVQGCDRQGIYVGYKDDSRIANNNVISDNDVHHNGLSRNPGMVNPVGIQIEHGQDNVVRGNLVSDHRGTGMNLYAAESTQVRDNTVAANDRGLVVGGSNNVIEHNDIVRNTVGLEFAAGGSNSPSVNNNRFCSNAEHAVSNRSVTVTVSAQHNWWGAASGPSKEGSGPGDSVSEGVAYEPFLTNPPLTGPCAP